MKQIQIIIGSVRSVRVGTQIASWLGERTIGIDGARFETVDLRDWPLPMGDEPQQPKRGNRDGYRHDHTRAWSRKIDAADGYVFLTPQYNWGYPAALKNALDHLFHEWQGKPALIISYGFHGGVKAAAQLREVLIGLRMEPLPVMPALRLMEEHLTPDRLVKDPALAFADFEEAARQALLSLVGALDASAGEDLSKVSPP